jgi:hypothetical protein
VPQNYNLNKASRDNRYKATTERHDNRAMVSQNNRDKWAVGTMRHQNNTDNDKSGQRDVGTIGIKETMETMGICAITTQSWGGLSQMGWAWAQACSWDQQVPSQSPPSLAQGVLDTSSAKSV